MPYIGNQPGTGVRSRFIYTATASQTTFSGADNNSKTLKYSDADYIDVYLNGVCLVPVTDYAASTKTSVVLTQAASLNDTLEVVAYDIATISDTVSKADGGTFEANVTFAAGADIITETLGTDNVRLGENAGDSIASGGTNNVTIGKDAGTALTTGDGNVAVGFEALKTEDADGTTTAVGYQALKTQNAGADSHNTAIGNVTGTAITTGVSNTIVGSLAGDALTVGGHNVAMGYEALSTDTQGSHTTAIGRRALKTQNFASATDSHNTAIGNNAGLSITTGVQNTIVGSNTADALTTGQYNTALGYKALSLDTQGNRAVAVGYEALANQNFTSSSDNQNTAVGFHAGKEITTGTENVAIGGEALDALTVGNGNVAVGVQALSTDVNGSRSVAVGATALKVQEASGSTSNNMYNVAMGYGAGLDVTSGYYHTMIGGLAADDMTTGVGNTVIGYQAGDDITTDSDYNVCIGYNAGDGLVSDGDANVFVGADTISNTGTADNQIVIGYSVSSVGGGYITLGNNSGGRIYNHPYSNATWTHTSDERMKKDIQTNTDCGLDFINDLRTVTYKWKAPSEHPNDFLSYNADQTEATHTGKMYGFIAQEVKAAMDTHNITDFAGWHSIEEQGGQQGISYEMFVMPLVKAVQELSAKVDALETENTAIKSRLDALEAG